MAKTELQVLEGAYAFLDSPKKWTKEDYVRSRPRGGFCACLDGALMIAAGRIPVRDGGGYARLSGSIVAGDAYWGAFGRLADLSGVGGVVRFNDAEATRFADVRALLRKAIRAAKAAA